MTCDVCREPCGNACEYDASEWPDTGTHALIESANLAGLCAMHEQIFSNAECDHWDYRFRYLRREQRNAVSITR